MSVGEYNDDFEREGAWLIYDGDELITELNYKKDRKHGLERRWNRNFNYIEEIMWNNGIKHGIQRFITHTEIIEFKFIYGDLVETCNTKISSTGERMTEKVCFKEKNKRKRRRKTVPSKDVVIIDIRNHSSSISTQDSLDFTKRIVDSYK